MALLFGLFVVLVVDPLMVGVLPWAISSLTPRYGWTESGIGFHIKNSLDFTSAVGHHGQIVAARPT
jgi:hypothetical protein